MRAWQVCALLLLGTTCLSGASAANDDFVILKPSRENIVKFANESFFVSCHTKQAGVRPTWTNPKGVVLNQYPETNRIHVEEISDEPGKTKQMLFFKQVMKSDQGRYTCSYTQQGLKHATSFTLSVFQPISFESTNTNQAAAEGTNYTVKCDVKGVPKPRVVWKANGRKLIKGKHIQTPAGLVIVNVRRSDAGQYQCKAIQIAEFISDFKDVTINVAVQHGPEWVPGARKIDLAYGFVTGNVNLTCEASAEPPPIFNWFKNNKLIKGNDYYIIHNEPEKSTLQVMVNDPSVFGKYKCSVSNKLGTIRREMELKEGERPVPPEFEVKSVTSEKAILEITGPRDVSMPLTGYSVQFKVHTQRWNTGKLQNFKIGDPYILRGLEDNSRYTIRVAALNAAGAGAFTKEREFETKPVQTASSAFHAVASPGRLTLLVGLATLTTFGVVTIL